MANLGISLPKASSNKIGVSLPKPAAAPKPVVTPKPTVVGPSSKAPTMSVAPSASIPKLGPSSSAVPNMSTPTGPVAARSTATPVAKSGGGGSNRNMAVGGLGILKGLYGGEGTTADNGISNGTPTVGPNTTQTTVSGAPAMERTSYATTAPKGMNPSDLNTGAGQNYADRATQQQMIAQAEAEKQANITNIQGQLAALQAQKDKQEQTPIDVSYAPDTDPNVDTYEKQLARLERQLQEANQDSPEVLAAKQAEQALVAEEANIKAGLSGSIAEVKDQPIPFGFITGQQSALENRANAKLEGIAAKRIPLQQQLANLQSKKQAALDVVRSRISTTEGRKKDATNIYDTNYKRSNELQDQVIKQQAEARKEQIEQANIERKFQEDVRRFGLEYALKQKQAAISQMNAESNRIRADKAGTSGDLPEWLTE